MSRNNLRASRRSLDKYCASFEFVSVGPKRLLKTQIFEKTGNLSSEEKKIWPIFFHIIDCDRPEGTLCKGPLGNLTKAVEVLGSFL